MINFVQTPDRMNESLQSARNIHQIIIVVCAAITVFALSLRTDLNKYDKARLLLHDLDLAISDVNADRVKRIKTAAYEGGGQRRFNLFVDNSSYRNKKLWEIRELLSQNWKSLDSINLVFDGGGNLTVHGNKTTFSAAEFPVEAKPSDGVWRSEREYFHGSDYLRAFRLKGFFKGYGSIDSLFRDIQPVWFEIRNSSIENAIQNLSDLSVIEGQKEKGDVDVSGLKVTGELIYIIGPIILMLLIIYLITLTIHVQSLIEIREQAETAHSFPWIALFPNKWSNGISFFSLIILPYSVSALMVYKTQLGSELMTIMLSVYFASFIGIGSILIYQLFLTRRKIRSLR